MRLGAKVAIVTGAGRGIGKAIASAFAQEGAHVVLASRTSPEVEGAAAQVRHQTELYTLRRISAHSGCGGGN